MQQKNSADNFMSDMQSTIKNMFDAVPTSLPFDMKSAMEAQRKNMQALTEMNQRAFQGWQALAQRQAEMMSQFVQDNSGLARETMTEGTPQDKFARQAEILKTAYEKSILNSRELAEIMRKCSIDTAEVINRRMMSSLSEIKASSKE